LWLLGFDSEAFFSVLENFHVSLCFSRTATTMTDPPIVNANLNSLIPIPYVSWFDVAIDESLFVSTSSSVANFVDVDKFLQSAIMSLRSLLFQSNVLLSAWYISFTYQQLCRGPSSSWRFPVSIAFQIWNWLFVSKGGNGLFPSTSSLLHSLWPIRWFSCRRPTMAEKKHIHQWLCGGSLIYRLLVKTTC
jgi:hypothetical protein